MKKLVIFDLDGTLLNTIADLAAATNQALQYYGYPTHETEAYRFFVGNGINKLFERALPEGERTEENVLKIRSQFIPYYDEHNADLSRPYPGISELLKTLQQQVNSTLFSRNKLCGSTGTTRRYPRKTRSIHHKRNHDKSRSQTGRYTLCR